VDVQEAGARGVCGGRVGACASLLLEESPERPGFLQGWRFTSVCFA